MKSPAESGLVALSGRVFYSMGFPPVNDLSPIFRFLDGGGMRSFLWWLDLRWDLCSFAITRSSVIRGIEYNTTKPDSACHAGDWFYELPISAIWVVVSLFTPVVPRCRRTAHKGHPAIWAQLMSLCYTECPIAASLDRIWDSFFVEPPGLCRSEGKDHCSSLQVRGEKAIVIEGNGMILITWRVGRSLTWGATVAA